MWEGLTSTAPVIRDRQALAVIRPVNIKPQPVNSSQDGQPTCRDCERWILLLWHRWSSLGKSANIRMNSQIGLIISVVWGNGKSLDRIFSLQYYIVVTVSAQSVVDLHKWPGSGGWRLRRVGGRWARGSRTCRSEAPPARWPGRRCAPSDRTSSTASPWDSRATSRPSDTWHTAAQSYNHRFYRHSLLIITLFHENSSM